MAEYIEREKARQIAFTSPFFSNALMEEIKVIPAADVAPVVHGGWIPLLESEISGWNPEFAGKDPIGGYMCSVCKEEAIYDCNDEFVLSKFCPYCGAKMGGDGDSEFC